MYKQKISYRNEMLLILQCRFIYHHRYLFYTHKLQNIIIEKDKTGYLTGSVDEETSIKNNLIRDIIRI